MAAIKYIKRTVALDGGPITEQLPASFFTGEYSAHTFIIAAVRGGEPLALTGTVTASFINGNDEMVPISACSIVDGAAVVTLADGCYHVSGRFTLTIYVNGGAIYDCASRIQRRSTNSAYDPTDSVPSLPEIQAEVAAMRAAMTEITAAIAAAENVDIDMTTATDQATVTITRPDGTQKSQTIRAVVGDDYNKIKSNFDNLFAVPTSWTSGYYIHVTGQPVPFTNPSRNYSVSDFIDCTGVSKLSFYATMYYAFYDENQGVLSVSPTNYLDVATLVFVNVPDGAKYFRCTKETLNNPNTEYTIYAAPRGYDPTFKNEIFIQNANLFDKRKARDGYVIRNGDIINPTEVNGARTDAIPVSPGDVVHFTQFAIFPDDMKGGMYSNGAFVSAPQNVTVSGSEMYFTVPSGIDTIRLNLLKASINTTMLTINQPYPSAYIPFSYHFSDLIYDPEDADYSYLLGSFRTIGAAGDSLASGEVCSNNTSDTNHDMFEHSWLQYMARQCGFTGINFSSGGLSARTWLTHTNGLPKALIEANKCNCYIIGLGANDMNFDESTYLGTASDIGTSADTFYGNYSRIIEQLKIVQPKAKFFLLTLSWLYTETNPYITYSAHINEAIRAIGQHYTNCYVIDLEQDPFFYTADVQLNMRSGHYNAIGYNMMGKHLAQLIGKYMYEHQSEFRQIEFIGTEYEWV